MPTGNRCRLFSYIHIKLFVTQQKSGDAAVFGVPLALIDSVEDSNIGHIPQ